MDVVGAYSGGAAVCAYQLEGTALDSPSASGVSQKADESACNVTSRRDLVGKVMGHGFRYDVAEVARIRADEHRLALGQRLKEVLTTPGRGQAVADQRDIPIA